MKQILFGLRKIIESGFYVVFVYVFATCEGIQQKGKYFKILLARVPLQIVVFLLYNLH